jgi:hypothetical protein
MIAMEVQQACHSMITVEKDGSIELWSQNLPASALE